MTSSKYSEEDNHFSVLLSPSRLLDKLLVVCPNVDYCEEVLTRCELEAHLLHRCRGAVTRCIKSSLGCTFQGPRSALQSHLWECPYRDQNAGKNPVTDGEVSTIEVQRQEGESLGISVVGGCDTPLVCTVIQEVFPDGAVAHDGRLMAGDQILEVNGEDLTQATHHQAVVILAQFFPVCRLTVYRERAEENRPIEKEEILKITLCKHRGRQLGIKLVGKRFVTLFTAVSIIVFSHPLVTNLVCMLMTTSLSISPK
ncbi:ligand of Numb protein X 2 [Elysia marginata]|uniref:Ligand of Numb protein X 2 n=1 Tax=Elysia marginata TaxID=1093978 RepID=A0AAV4HT39_9GAST|nr:ligand of Numb protein X 2 [Elysia marginata]